MNSQAVRVTFDLTFNGDRPPQVSSTAVHISPLVPPDPELLLAVAFRQRFGFAPAEGRAFARLLGQGCVTREDLHTVISGADAPTTSAKLVDVVISNLRKKLPSGVKISTVYGRGYQLDEVSRSKVNALLAAAGVTPSSTDQQHEFVEG
jgi:hypothetical protein